MKSSIRNIVSFFIVLLISFNGMTQKRSGLQKRNNKQEPIQYGSYEHRSRALLMVDDSMILVGNPDGALILVNLKQKRPKLLHKKFGFEEIRDIERIKDGYLLMHSGEDGKFTYLDNEFNPIFKAPEKFKGVFFNSMDFRNNIGVLIGDPVDSTFSLYYSLDFGLNWQEFQGQVPAEEGEGSFASSGTSVQIINDRTFVFISGGKVNHFFKTDDFGFTWKKVLLPFFPGKLSGAFSVAFADSSNGVVVGGDYISPNLKNNTAYYTYDGGETWYNSKKTPRGYRSCVIHKNGIFYACGTLGIDYSTDGGKTWKAFADGKYYKIVATDDKLIATVKHGKLQVFDLLK